MVLFGKTIIANPPGETIKEQMEFFEISHKSLSIKMGMSEECMEKLLNGDLPLTTDIADRLEFVFQIPAQFWLNLEQFYRDDLICAKAELT